MSAGAASRLPPEGTVLLEKKGLAQLATLGPDGGPQCTPLWYLWDGSRLILSTITSRQKYRNLSRNGKVAVNIVDPDNPTAYVEMRGLAELDLETGRATVDRLAKRYLDVEVYPWDAPDDVRVAITVTPDHVTWLLA